MTRSNLSVLFFSFLFFSCRPDYKTPPDTLVIGLEASPQTLDPRLATDAYSAKITRLLHNGLFRLNERLEVVPDLVEEFEFIPPTQYLFRLRPGLLFSDGRSLTAEDVRYTLESVLDPALASPFRETLSRIKTIQVVDPLKLEVVLKEPFSPFLSAMTIGIVPAGGKDPSLGTGPFQLEEFRSGEKVILKKNGNTFRTPPRIQRVEFRIVPDDNLRVLELRNHRIDLLQNNVPPQLIRVLRERKDLVFEATEGINFSYVGMNLRKDPLQRQAVRQAIAHAIDIPSLIAYRMAGMAHPATGMLAPIHWAYEPDVTRYRYDPAKARELLDKAGYPDPDGQGPAPRFSLTWKTSTSRDRIGLARLVARYLKEVGIEVRILPLEWGTFFHDVGQGNFELYSLTWVGLTEPDIFFHTLHSSAQPPVGANRGGYENKKVDQLTEEGRKVADRLERKGSYAAVQKIVAEELPFIPLWYEENFALFSKRVKGIRLRPDASFEWITEAYKE